MTMRKSADIGKALMGLLVSCLLLAATNAFAAPGDWPEIRQNSHLTAIQSLPGAMTAAPARLAQFDLGRSQPAMREIKKTKEVGPFGLSIVAGSLQCYDTAGKRLWESHPAGLNYARIEDTDDFDGDGKQEILLAAGRPTAPFGAAALVALDDGRLLWRYDVEPMSYEWYLYAGEYLPGVKSKQIVVIMQAYPPDKDNGYMAVFEYPEPGATPRLKWRYDFSEYTCFPSFMQTDLDGDGIKELVVECHSRMWFLDAVTGKLKHFAKWDVSPANVRSYGLVRFVDLNKDGREDFLCIANFAQHHEVLLNRDGKMEAAWHYGWPESVTTGKVVSTWAEPPNADVDGDGAFEIVLAMYNSENEQAWLLRVYDAVTGKLKYRFPGVIAVSCQDVDGDGGAEILADASTDPTRTTLTGARLLKVVDGALKVVWQDDGATAMQADESRGDRQKMLKNADKASDVSAARIKRGDAVFTLVLSADGQPKIEPWTRPAPGETADFSAVPAVQGPSFPTLLAADVNGDGVNELMLYAEPLAQVLRFTGTAFEKVAEYTSSCAPAIADLNGDGKADLVLATIGPTATPVIEVVTPALGSKPLWRRVFPPPGRAGLPQSRKAYVRTIHLTGKPTPDLYVWAGTPVVRSAGLNGVTGEILWDKGETPNLERYWGPSMNLASAWDFNGDGKEDLVFTNPDYYCVADGPTGNALLGPMFPPDIFKQPSQGLYTYPAILEVKDKLPTVCLVAGHYFQGAMSLRAEPYWYKLPVAGENRSAVEAFLQLKDGTWLMGFGRQNGRFACVEAATGRLRWELPVEATCSDVVTGDVDGDGQFEFVFGTSHGGLFAVGDAGDKARVVWKTEGKAAVGAPILADLNGDGRVEIVCATSDGYVSVYGVESKRAGV